MAFNIGDRITWGRERIANASPSKLIIGGLVLALATAGLIYILVANNQTPYEVLYSDLTPEDAGAIAAELKKSNQSYRLAAGGTAIETPVGQAQEARLDLAMKGLPAKSGVGFELFDNQKLGVTDLQQKINLQRAVTGELERTIMRFPEVQDARVHLTVPKETLFIEDQKDPTASVVLTLKRGATLEKNKLMGIVHLLTAAIDGLVPDNVSIIDTDGGLLWSKDSQKPGLLNDDQLKKKTAYERELANRINSMLEKVLGPYKATTQVHCDLDLKEVVTSEDIYDPERVAVRSEQRIQERSTGPGRANAGIPNATYELGTANRQNANQGGNQEVYSRSEETNNYEITNIKRKTISASGDLKKVTVAVLVDGFFTTAEDGTRVFNPLPEAKLDQLRQAIRDIIGFDETRGDSVSVSSLEFYREEAVSVWAIFVLDLLREFGRPFINLLLIILFFLFIVRPILNWLKKEVEPIGSGAEQAVLPDYPLTGGPGDSLPLPLPPREEITPTPSSLGSEEAMSPEQPAGQDELVHYDDETPDETPEEPEEDEEEAPRLAYGQLSRDNVMPLARENMDRTVGLLRSWIEQKPATEAREK
ncbi:MAG: flagellar M-ring protein FliF [Deltaproteobacteria bacterium]|jgi:flagellar M-ring protein FliF|nr:flagellar M-ring protein FliF [Deltaproteobacteria bacterium]